MEKRGPLHSWKNLIGAGAARARSGKPGERGERTEGGRIAFTKSLASRIVFVSIPVLVLAVAVSIFICTQKNAEFTDTVLDTQISRAFSCFNGGLSDAAQAWTVNAVKSANDRLIAQAISAENKDSVSAYMQALGSDHTNFMLVLDKRGGVLFSSNPLFGEDASALPFMQPAMKGAPASGVYTDSKGDIFSVSAMPVKDVGGYFTGAVAAGSYYNDARLLKAIKQQQGAELTVYKGDARWTTTLVHNDSPTVGDKMDAAIAARVLGGMEYTGKVKVYGDPYFVKYAPILGAQGKPVGALAAELPIGDIERSRTDSVRSAALITLIPLAICIASTYAYIRGWLIRPMLKLKRGAEALAEGDTGFAVDMKPRGDELGALLAAFGSVCGTLHVMIDDTAMLTQAALAGDLSARADAGRHKGDYRKIVQGFNDTLDAVTAPVEEEASVLHALSQGNLSVRVQGDFQGDHAIIKDALNETIGTLHGYIAEISAVLARLSSKDLTARISSEYRGEFKELRESINGISESLNAMVGEIGMAANQVAAGTVQVSGGSQLLSQAAVGQAASLEELSVTAAKLAEHTQKNTALTDDVNRLASDARQKAEAGSKKMHAMHVAMDNINETAASIGKIIKVIDDIAFQTNLLALNAAIEAAHAGQYGRGFSVVADEVRKLAQRSAAAASETTALIGNSVKKAAAGTRLSADTQEALNEILSSVEQVAALTGDIAAASGEQAAGIAELNNGITLMNTLVQQNSATAEQSAATAQELSGQADMLKEMVAAFILDGGSGQ